MKKLYRDTKNEMLAGVCAGLAKYLDIDPTIIRLIWVVITFAGGSGLIAYIICAIVIPTEPDFTEVDWENIEKENTENKE